MFGYNECWGEKMQKILFFDLDGTLLTYLDGESYVSEGVVKQLKRLKDKGYLLFVASGRPFAFISKVVSDINFDGYILCNGAHVEINDKIIYKQALDTQKVKKLINELEIHNSQYVIETSKYSYLKPEFEKLYDFYMQCNINKAYLARDYNIEDVYSDILKIEINAKEENVAYLQSIISDNFNYDSHGTENSFEIYDKKVTKATGVKKVLDYYNLPIEASYAFGDGTNDLEMIQIVGTGVAMGNGVDELKEVADIVCESTYDDGLSKILEELF